jgi:midasin
LIPDGTIVFRGPVVHPARSGEWIALDELNLAPPDVLEALNILLDDNRENRIPETGVVVRAAPGFVIFATQNPPGLNGGRKELCQDLRGRFIEKDVKDITETDLKDVLMKRSSIPLSFPDQIIVVMRQFHVQRRGSQMFAGKIGFVTVRDLFRWA